MTVETTGQPATDVTVPTPATADLADLQGLAVLQQWADANQQALRLVSDWVFTDLVPLHHWPLPAGMSRKTWPNPRISAPGEAPEEYRRRAEIAASSAAGTVLRGIAIGLPPNVALEQMHSIHGTIGMKTKAKQALATSRGIKTWDVEVTATSVTCAGIRPLDGMEFSWTVTMAEAKAAGWAENAAYEKTPKDMLWARAMSRVLDRVAGHVLFGLPSVEDVDAEPVASVATRVSVSDLAAVPPAAPLAAEAAALTGPAAPAASGPAPATDMSGHIELVSPADVKRIQSILTRAGITDIGLRKDAIRLFSKRTELASTKDLTAEEAAGVITGLEELATSENVMGALASKLADADQAAELAAQNSDSGVTGD